MAKLRIHDLHDRVIIRIPPEIVHIIFISIAIIVFTAQTWNERGGSGEAIFFLICLSVVAILSFNRKFTIDKIAQTVSYRKLGLFKITFELSKIGVIHVIDNGFIRPRLQSRHLVEISVSTRRKPIKIITCSNEQGEDLRAVLRKFKNDLHQQETPCHTHNEY